MLRNILTQLTGKYVHDALLNSPTFHKVVRATHDAVKGIKSQPVDYDPNSAAVTHQIKKFATIYKDEMVANFKANGKGKQ